MGTDKARRVARRMRASFPRYTDVPSENPGPTSRPEGQDARRARRRGGLSLGYFSLATQREVTRPAEPDDTSHGWRAPCHDKPRKVQSRETENSKIKMDPGLRRIDGRVSVVRRRWMACAPQPRTLEGRDHAGKKRGRASAASSSSRIEVPPKAAEPTRPHPAPSASGPPCSHPASTAADTQRRWKRASRARYRTSAPRPCLPARRPHRGTAPAR